MGHFVLVLNPRAGAGRAARQRARLEKELHKRDVRFDVRLTERPGHATELVREALRAGAPGVAVVGGDGTLNEAINGFFTPDGDAIAPGAWVGPLPIGTGGDFRKSVNIPSKVEAMVERLVRAEPRPLDVGWMTYRTREGRAAQSAFVNIASFGLGGMVDRFVNDGPKWLGGRAAFLLGTLRAMRRYENQRVRLTVDDAPPRESRILNLAIANGQYFGGGMHIAPEASLDDGLFDVVAIERDGIFGQARLAPALYRGALLEREGVFFTRGARIQAQPLGDQPVELDVDGEAPGILPATFEMRAGVVRLR